MATTTLFVEIIIIGAQGAIWLFIIFSSFMDLPNSFDLLGVDFAVLAIPIIALLYTLGIIIDRVSDNIGFKALEYTIRDRVMHKIAGEYSKNVIKENIHISWTPIRRFILSTPQQEGLLFDYYRHRIRIMRSSALNFLLTAIGLLIFLLRQNPLYYSIVLFGIIISILLCCLCAFAWWRLVLSWSRLACRGYIDYLKHNDKNKERNKRNE